MTDKEFSEKWGKVDVDTLTDEQFNEFKNDCFVNITVPNSFTFKVTKKIRIPVTVSFVLNGTPKVVGTYQCKPVYGYKTELVDETVVVYAEKLENAVAILKDKFGTDFVYTIL